MRGSNFAFPTLFLRRSDSLLRKNFKHCRLSRQKEKASEPLRQFRGAFEPRLRLNHHVPSTTRTLYVQVKRSADRARRRLGRGGAVSRRVDDGFFDLSLSLTLVEIGDVGRGVGQRSDA